MKNETFHFTAEQLIKVLKTFPQSLPVLISGYENGFENFYHPEILKLRHEPENMYYDGEFQIANDKDENVFEAAVLSRVVRND